MIILFVLSKNFEILYIFVIYIVVEMFYIIELVYIDYILFDVFLVRK